MISKRTLNVLRSMLAMLSSLFTQQYNAKQSNTQYYTGGHYSFATKGNNLVFIYAAGMSFCFLDKYLINLLLSIYSSFEHWTYFCFLNQIYNQQYNKIYFHFFLCYGYIILIIIGSIVVGFVQYNTMLQAKKVGSFHQSSSFVQNHHAQSHNIYRTYK